MSARGALADARRWSVVEQCEDESRVALHRVTLAAALSEVLRLHSLATPITSLDRLADLQLLGVLRFTASALGKYKRRRDAEGVRDPKLRKQVVLSWGARPPLHETVLAIAWDYDAPDLGQPDPSAAPALRVGDELLEAIEALVPAEARTERTCTRDAPSRATLAFEDLLRLRALSGWKIARNLELSLGATMAGEAPARGATFVLDGRRDLDACMRVLDELLPPARCLRSTRHAQSLALHYQGALDGHSYQLVLLDDPTLERLAVRADADEEAVVARLGAALGRSEPRDWETCRTQAAWLCAALSPREPGAFEARLRRQLCSGNERHRRWAFEAAVLAGSPAARELLHEHLPAEQDPRLRSDVALTLALVSPCEPPPTAGELAAAARALDSLRDDRLRDGLRLAAALRDARLRARLTELRTHPELSKDVRFVARALMVFGAR